MSWDLAFNVAMQASKLGLWLLRWGVVAPFFLWPLALWTRAWPLIRRRKGAVGLLVPGLWALGLVVFSLFFAWLPSGFWRQLTLPVASFFREELDAFYLELVLPPWLVGRTSQLQRVALLWLWAPVVLTIFASPLYLSLVLLRSAALSPDDLFGWGKKTASRVFGSAAFASNDEGEGWLQKVRPAALVMGRHARKKKRYYTVSGHVLTCAPTGAGKGIGCVLPCLATYQGSVFCLDIKGENYLRAAGQRRKLGQEVWLVDPFGATNTPNVALDWLAALRGSGEEAVSLAAYLAEAMIVRAPGTESYWDDAAASLLQGLLLEAAQATGGHVGQVRGWLTGPVEVLEAKLKDMAGDQERGWGIVARAANGFLAKADKERSGVLSTAQRHTAFLDDPRIMASLGASGTRPSVALGDFLQKPTTVFFVLPPDKFSAYNRFARVSLALVLQALVQRGLRPRENTLLLLDEFAQLGCFPPIEEGLSIMRGYGASIWCLVQDLSQLQAVYPKWRAFLANSHLQIFGTQDMVTARYVSDLLGQQTVSVQNVAQGRSWTHDQTGSSSANESSSETGRALYTPDEVRRLPSDQVLLFERGQAPRQLQRLDVTQKSELAQLHRFAEPAKNRFGRLKPKETQHAIPHTEGVARREIPLGRANQTAPSARS